MSIELDVRLGNREISKEKIRESLASCCGQRFGGTALWLADSDPANSFIGGRQSTLSFSLQSEAEIKCLVYSSGSEQDLGDEGGWWICVAVVIRNAHSILLMSLASACIAELAETVVVDDALVLGLGPVIAPGQIFALDTP